LLAKFQRVIGIDWDKFAIAAAQENATGKETYVPGDIEVELDRALQKREPAKTVVIVDPPAVGLSANIRKMLIDLAPVTLIYVSCNPATLARDLSELQQKFTTDSVTPLDMFPQTAEIEVAVHLRL
jgi:tRNA/tmRNA/rRNA uracil-C5-methylase (TrmA/RlmC/RlmD family)